MNREAGLIIASVLLILGNAFFVMAEYAFLGARRSKIEAEAKRGNRTSQLLLDATQNIAPYVAGMQIGITMFGIGVGSITEPFITQLLTQLIGPVLPEGVRVLVSIIIVTLLMVVFGELVPKYLALNRPDTIARVAIRPMTLFVAVLKPLVWLVERMARLVTRMLGLKGDEESGGAIPKEELLLLVRSGGSEGVLAKNHAEMVVRTLRLDTLDARDIMVHRLDVKWLDADCSRDEAIDSLRKIPFSRVPLAEGDIDVLVGIVYLHDIIRHWDDPDFSLRKIARPIVAIPENLSMEKIVSTMREQKTQMLVVMDEYGGTSGVITLEDVVEEVFGELEDRLESDRPAMEVFPSGRVSARAEVRVDELLSKLEIDAELEDPTRTLAQLFMDELESVPKQGDRVETELGTLRVENMARNRITRVSVFLKPGFREQAAQSVRDAGAVS